LPGTYRWIEEVLLLSEIIALVSIATTQRRLLIAPHKTLPNMLPPNAGYMRRFLIDLEEPRIFSPPKPIPPEEPDDEANADEQPMFENEWPNTM
jgi:hypothetical protein